MTSRLAPRIGLADGRDRVRLKDTHQPCKVVTGLFMAPAFLFSDRSWTIKDGGTRIIELRRVESTAILTVVNKYAHAIEHMRAEVSEKFKIVGEGRAMVNAQAGAYGHWYAIDKSAMIENSLMAGYDGFCFVGQAGSEINFEHGFIPFGQRESMVDAEGRKFLIIEDGE